MVDPSLEEAIKTRLRTSAFAGWMGLRLHALGDGTSEVHLDVAPHHLNPGGIVHGGIVATLLDGAIGLALRTRLGMDRTHVTVNLSINYLKPFAHGRLIARGTAVHSGGRVGYGEAELFGDERLLARGTATFLVVAAPDAAAVPGGPPAGPAGDAG